MRNRLEINQCICKIENETFEVEKSTKYKFYGCAVAVNKKSCTITIPKHRLRKIFHRLPNFGVEFSNFLTQKFGRKYTVVPKIINVQASKHLNLRRKNEKLCEFLLHVDTNISPIKEVRIGREDPKSPDIYTGKSAILKLIKSGLGLYMSLVIEGKGFCCRIQISKNKSEFVTGFVFSHFGKHIQKLIEDLNTNF